MNKKLSRRDFLKLASVTSAGLALSACGVNATGLPTATSISPTNTLISPTGTPLPTETLTPTPTLPLEQLPQTKQALIEFVQAFQAAGVDISSEQLIREGLEIRTITGKNEKQYDIAFMHVDNPDGVVGDYPLMIKTEGKWTPVDQRNSDVVTGKITGVHYEYPLDKDDLSYRESVKEYGFIEIGTAAQWQWVFQNPKKPIFDDLRSNAFKILNDNTRLGLFNSLSWGNRFALPDWLVKGNFSKDELKRILVQNVTDYARFLVPYKPLYVVVANEVLGNPAYAGNDFWVEKLGMDEYLKTVFLIARSELPKGTKLVLNDFANNYSESPRAEKLFQLIQRNNQETHLIDAVGMQSPLLLLIDTYSAEESVLLEPTSSSSTQLMDRYMKMVQRYRDIKVDVVVTEAFVVQSSFPEPPENKERKQGQLYYEFARKSYEMNIPFFLFGPKDDDKSYPEGVDAKHNNTNPYLISDDGRKKIAYYKFIKAKFDATH